MQRTALFCWHRRGHSQRPHHGRPVHRRCHRQREFALFRSQRALIIYSQNVKPILTVGGWDGSIYWSSSVATAQNRSTLANSLAQYAFEHDFAGLDFE